LEQWRAQGRWPASFDRFWEGLKQRRGKQAGTRAMIEALLLGRKYGYSSLKEALEKALDLSCFDVEALRLLLSAERSSRRKVELIAEFDVASPEVADKLAAIDLHRLHDVSFWDALVLRAAKQAGCSILLSEDMQGNREIDGVQIVNPFQ
jgi:hypothetical protein